MTSKQPKIVIEKGQRESRVFEKHNCDIKESTMQNKKTNQAKCLCYTNAFVIPAQRYEAGNLEVLLAHSR